MSSLYKTTFCYIKQLFVTQPCSLYLVDVEHLPSALQGFYLCSHTHGWSHDLITLKVEGYFSLLVQLRGGCDVRCTLCVNMTWAILLLLGATLGVGSAHALDGRLYVVSARWLARTWFYVPVKRTSWKDIVTSSPLIDWYGSYPFRPYRFPFSVPPTMWTYTVECISLLSSVVRWNAHGIAILGETGSTSYTHRNGLCFWLSWWGSLSI